jgi:uncharacterized membrane protein
MTTWTKIKWGLRVLVALFVALFLHYVLPQHDTVQITNTYNRLTSVGTNSIFYSSPDVGTNEGDQRDIRFIEARYENGKVMIYRNEDTGWVWPPYFKYDSSNLQAEAGNLKSTDAAPKWAIVTHYGWRLPWVSAYPNAVAVRAASGPDDGVFPWINIMILTVLAALWFFLNRPRLGLALRAVAQNEDASRLAGLNVTMLYALAFGIAAALAALAGIFLASGTMHFVRPEPFEAIVPRRLPRRRALVYLSGAAELACAAGLLHPRTRRAAGFASAALLVAVFPGNLKMADDARRSRSNRFKALAFARLPLQLPMIRAALRATRT